MTLSHGAELPKAAYILAVLALLGFASALFFVLYLADISARTQEEVIRERFRRPDFTLQIGNRTSQNDHLRISIDDRKVLFDREIKTTKDAPQVVADPPFKLDPGTHVVVVEDRTRSLQKRMSFNSTKEAHIGVVVDDRGLQLEVDTSVRPHFWQ